MGDQSGLIHGMGTSLAFSEAPPRQTVALATRRSSSGCSHFDIYRTEQVHLTSTLFAGGDWHWRLTDRSGAILVDCGGYRNQRDCLAAVEALRVEAWSATVSKRPDLKRGPLGEPENFHDVRSE